METPYPFFALFEAANHAACAIRAYLLYPGMEFGSLEKWWADEGRRPAPHEGIDICYYRDGHGREKLLSPETRVPVMADGGILAICGDFLGQTVIVEHEAGGAGRFCSLYAHLRLLPGLAVGQRLQAGDIVGHPADTSGRRNRMPAHLHLSLARIDRCLPAATIDWHVLARSAHVHLLDPLSLLSREKIGFPSDNHWRVR